jgi:hypothetical protein
MEWKIRFLSHYFRVVKGGEKPEEGLKPYAYFYQYTYVSIYRQLQAAAAEAKRQPEISEEYLRHLAEEVTIEPVNIRIKTQRIVKPRQPWRRTHDPFKDICTRT